MQTIYIVFLSIILMALSACTPSYTTEKVGEYSRQIGLTDQYEISRWRNYTFSSDNQLLVAVDAESDEQASQLASVIAKNLSPFFTSVQSLSRASAVSVGLKEARRSGCHFLLAVQETSFKLAFDPTINARDTAQENDRSDTTDKYTRVNFLLSIIDANTGKVVDKVNLSVSTAHYDFIGSDFVDLLDKPISQLGSDLVGN